MCKPVFVYPVGQNFSDFPVTGEGSRQVCPSDDHYL